MCYAYSLLTKGWRKMANENTNLHKAKRFKDDGFYTTYETVENGTLSVYRPI